MNLLATLQLRPSFHQTHTWSISLSDTEGKVTGECQEAEGVWQLSAQELLALPAEVRAGHFPDRKSPYDWLDGIRVHFLIITDKNVVEESIHCPDCEFFPEYDALLKWCWHGLYEHSPDAYWVHLEHIFGYFGNWGSPVRRTPKGLRIFGSLGASDAAELQKRFDEVAEMPEPEIDMSNFRGAGKLLCPLFKQFFEQSPDSIWIVNSNARELMREAGLMKKAGVPKKQQRYIEAPYYYW
jgi:hypothetical protein